MNNQSATPWAVIKVLDPENCLVIKWRRFMLIIRVCSLILEPFFLYIPHTRGPMCSGMDVQAGIFFTVLRMILDLFHLLNVILKFRMALEAPGPKLFKRRRNLIKNSRLIAIKYLKSLFVFDVLALIPFAQILLWSRSSTVARVSWPTLVAYQIAIRIITMAPMDDGDEAFGVIVKNVWSGAIYNLSIFVLFGHFIGAVYYQTYLTWIEECLASVSTEMNTTHLVGLDCSKVHKDCVINHKELGYGMLSDAFANEIGSRSFTQKLIYCFVWGVRCLSSIGQTFDTGFDVMETTFSCMIMIIGLVLLADLIARMQTTVQSAGSRRERQRIKQRKLEEWTHYHDLPPDLKGLVRQSVQSEWQSSKGIDDEGILNSLPSDLRRDIRNHLYKERIRNIPPFSRMDDQLLNFVCGHLKTYIGAEGTYIVLQGDPLQQVYFIFSGIMQLTHHIGGRSSSKSLKTGDFFGEDLLTWASQPNTFSQDLPLSTFTVKCISNVEAFCLPAEDVRLLTLFNYGQRFQDALREHHA